jgi:DDE superfamily endonuclease/Tc5 transposase DNA-binding domain
VATLQPQSGD